MKNVINTDNIKQARKEIEKLAKKKKKVIVQGENVSFNRQILENKYVDTLILTHKQPWRRGGRLKQRESGLNHILCKIAKENNITLAVDLQEFREEKDKKQRAIMLSRLIQNIKLMKKAKNKIN